MTSADLLTTIITVTVGIIGAYFALSAETQAQMIAAGVAIAAAAYAWYQNRQKNTTTAAMTSGTPESQNPTIIATLPPAVWQMKEGVRDYMVRGASEDNRLHILAQIDAAEAAHLTHYRVNFHGGLYIVDYGLVESSVGNIHDDQGQWGGDLPDTFVVHPRTGRVWRSVEMAVEMDGATDAPIAHYHLVGDHIIQVPSDYGERKTPEAAVTAKICGVRPAQE